MKTVQTTNYEYDKEGRVLRQTVTREDASDKVTDCLREMTDYIRGRYGDLPIGAIRQQASTSQDGSRIVSTKSEAWTGTEWVDTRELAKWWAAK